MGISKMTLSVWLGLAILGVIFSIFIYGSVMSVGWKATFGIFIFVAALGGLFVFAAMLVSGFITF